MGNLVWAWRVLRPSQRQSCGQAPVLFLQPGDAGRSTPAARLVGLFRFVRRRHPVRRRRRLTHLRPSRRVLRRVGPRRSPRSRPPRPLDDEQHHVARDDARQPGSFGSAGSSGHPGAAAPSPGASGSSPVLVADSSGPPSPLAVSASRIDEGRCCGSLLMIRGCPIARPFTHPARSGGSSSTSDGSHAANRWAAFEIPVDQFHSSGERTEVDMHRGGER